MTPFAGAGLRPIALASLALVALMEPSLASVPAGLGDLIDTRQEKAESRLVKRGYEIVDTQRSGNRTTQYWWNGAERSCARVKINQEVVRDVDQADNQICRQYARQAAQARRASSSAAPVVGSPVNSLSDLVGAKGGQAENAVIQRGYRFVRSEPKGDRMYGLWSESGSNACVRIITSDGRYESITYTAASACQAAAGASTSGNDGLVGRPVNGLSDLVGAKGGQAENTVIQRGYRFVRSEPKGNKMYGLWSESGSNACVRIITSDGRYESITYISDSACR